MPLTDIGSYVPLMDEFALHWQAVNTELGGTPATDLKLAGNYGRPNFLVDQTTLSTLLTTLVGLENNWEIAIQNRDNLKELLSGKLLQFRQVLRGLLPDTVYPAAAPLVPQIRTAEHKFLVALDDLGNLWTKINADTTVPGFTPPLVISGYTLATFQTDLASLRTSYFTVAASETELRLSRNRRDELLDRIRERFTQYRAMVEGILGPDHALTKSLPDIWPAEGHTPAAVTLSGSWNLTTEMARLTWTESTDPNLLRYEVRMCLGATYDADTAENIANITTDLTEHETTMGLPNSGDVATFKLFVVLASGNVAGSNPVTIQHP